MLQPDVPTDYVEKLCQELGVPAYLAQLLAQRGIQTYSEARRFFLPEWEQLHDPFLMRDMTKAAARVTKALKEEQRILVYGDYDVDGTTAVALLITFLHPLSTQLDYYVPDRYAEGYGISTQGVQYAVEEGFDLIIALDCGIKAHESLGHAQANGIDVIVCDHHLPDDTLPPAYAILNPKRPDDTYPFKELTGCGIGFKLIQALCRELNVQVDETQFLDLVAISIACDIVPVNGENRVLLHHGIQQMAEGLRPGVQALVGELWAERVPDTSDLVFGIGPRINAAGRIGHGSLAVEVLLGVDEEEVAELAARVNEHNAERRDLDKSITQEALEMLDSESTKAPVHSTVVYHEGWHKGVIGIVAARLTESYYRPTIVLTRSNGVAAGSARSVQGFDIHEAIGACSDLLDQYGGHAFAAGLVLPVTNITALKERFEEVVAERIDPALLVPELKIDLALSFTQVTDRLYNSIERMGPFGPTNMRPVFVSHGVVDAGNSRLVGADESHVKLSLKQSDSPDVVLDGIGFSLADKWDIVRSGNPFSVVYTVDQNIWQGRRSLQLMVKDIQLTDALLQ